MIRTLSLNGLLGHVMELFVVFCQFWESMWLLLFLLLKRRNGKGGEVDIRSFFINIKSFGTHI